MDSGIKSNVIDTIKLAGNFSYLSYKKEKTDKTEKNMKIHGKSVVDKSNF